MKTWGRHTKHSLPNQLNRVHIFLCKTILPFLLIHQLINIQIYIDSMVMNNDDALKRHGVQPTYKKVGILHFPVNTSGINLEFENFLSSMIMRFKPDNQI